ncbi:MAG: hypothetical protein LQ343_002891 [Gyalolechia ehrenbergii]|nr:MAG: hypothetical protein LQ343_002891 [Gyalolechia ehrenbergii]
MAPLQKPKARRRWTLTRNRGTAEESSSEDYGEEILPTVDQVALATLPPADQEKFKEMRKKDRKNVIARWRKEGKPVPKSSNSNSSESIEALVQHSSSAPQLPELQMDVTLSTEIETGRQASATNDTETHERSLGAGRSELAEGQQARHASLSPFSTHHNQTTTHPASESEDTATHYNQTTAHSTLQSEDSDETTLWLRVMDSDHYMRGRRRFRDPLRDQTDIAAGEGPSSSHQTERAATDPSQIASTSGNLAFNDCYPGFGMTQGESSASAAMTYGPTPDTPTTPSDQLEEDHQHERVETVEQRRLRELQVQETFLQRIQNDREREYARFRGLGPVPPGLALSANAPSDSERLHARTATNVYNVLASTGEVYAHDAVAAARRAVVAGPSPGAGNGFSEARESLFVRPSPSFGQDISPVRHWQAEARSQDMHLSPPSTTGQEQRMGQLEEEMGNVKINPIKRMAQKFRTRIKNVFKSRGERAQAPAASRSASQLRVREETRVETATAVTMTPVRAPQPTQTQHLRRAPPPLQPASAPHPTRQGSPVRRTTRAMMENYD